MNVFLKKVRARTPFSRLDPVRVEPLELAYLKAACEATGANTWIIDDLFDLLEPAVIPDVVVLTGYNTAEQAIIDAAAFLRRRFPNVRIIVGGIHAQRNSAAFHVPSIDVVFHSPDLELFQKLLQELDGQSIQGEPSGFDRQVASTWKIGPPRPVRGISRIRPDRSLTKEVIAQTRYLDKARVALVKGRTGCPFQCDFCYCRLLNDGTHLPADYGDILDEALALEADHIWVVDDVFLASRKDALDFIQAARHRGASNQTLVGNLRPTLSGSKPPLKPDRLGSLKLIVYLRADFILKNRDLLGQLKECGLEEVIVGFEAVTNSELDAYNKQTDALDYPEVIRLLKQHQIDLTALFMVSPAYKWTDFRHLASFLKINRIETYTISILTPIKGTDSYEQMQIQLVTKDPEKFDFLHLVTRSRLPKPVFYLLFWQLHLRLIRSPRIRSFIRLSLFQRKKTMADKVSPDGLVGSDHQDASLAK